MKGDTNFLIAATIFVMALSIFLTSRVFEIDNGNNDFLFNLAIAPVLLTFVYAKNYYRIGEISKAGRSPDFMVRPIKALGYWMLALLAAMGVFYFFEQLKGATSPGLGRLSALPIIFMALAVRFTAYENTEV